MKRQCKHIISAAIICIAAFSASAQQNLRTAYFLDGYTYNYKLNPSFAPERSFFAFPALGNIGIGVESNLGLSSILYPTADGNLTTFLSPEISDSDFLKQINKINNINLEINESLIATGFRIGKTYHTIDLSLKAGAGAALPKDLFAFIKTGSSAGATSWDISRIGLRANARLELAYGYSRPIFDWIRVGGRVKLLVGIAQANAVVDNMNLVMSGEKWAVTSHGKADISGPVSFGTKDGSNEIDFEDIRVPEDLDGIMDYISKPSIGVAFDLGASFDFLNYFTASVSVLDLGFISWKNTTSAVMPGGEWSFNGFGTISADGSGLDFDEQLSEMTDDLMQMIRMEKEGDISNRSKGLGATIHAAIEARMPFYERLSFGLLATQRIDGIYSWTEARLAANIAPVNCISASASYAISDFGHSLGGVINFHFPGFNLYAGLDSFLPLLDVTPQFVPVGHLNTNMTAGLTFTFGKAKGRYRK